MGKNKEEKSAERLELEKNTPYPYYVFFILGNEFCERYAYYGMRAILVIYLVGLIWIRVPINFEIQKNFLGFDNDYATTIYHAFVALCYFFPLIGGIIADSFWGKVKTILILSIVYLAGMVLMAVAAVPQIGGNEDKTKLGYSTFFGPNLRSVQSKHQPWSGSFFEFVEIP